MKPKTQAEKQKQNDYSLIICCALFLVVFYFEVSREQFLGIVPYLLFFAGLMTGTLLALEKKLNKKTLSALGGGPLLLTLIFFMPGKHENNYGQHLQSHALMAIGAYLILFPLYLRKQLLATVNGQVALYFTVLFWYLLSTDYPQVRAYFPVPLLILLAAGSLVCAFFSVRHDFLTSPLWRLGLYGWHLAILALISLLQVSRLSLSDLVDGIAGAANNGWGLYLGGISATFLAINLGMVAGLFLDLASSLLYLPITLNKDQLKRGLSGFRKNASDLESKYLDRYLPPVQLFLLFVVQGTLFVVNDRFHFMPQILLTYLTVALASLGLSLVHRLKAA